MENENPLITVLTLIFGILIGMVTIATLFYYVGVVNERPLTNEKMPQNASAMDVLRSFSCLGSENTQIMTYGVEDDFLMDRHGTEFTQLHRHDLSSEQTFKPYDDPDASLSFEETLLIPAGSDQGLLVIKARAVKPAPGPHIILETRSGDAGQPWRATIPTQAQDGIYQIRTNQLMVSNGPQTLSLADLLAVSDQAREIRVRLSPNMQVDMIGYSYCPNETSKTGTVMRLAEATSEPGIVQLECLSEDGSACTFETGTMACNRSIPLACFSDPREPAPDLAGWSGGHIKFTPAVSGESFQTADDAHLYCQSTFGESWRALSFMDGSANGIISGRGDANGISMVWVDVGARPQANCWGNRAAYHNGASVRP